MRRRFTEWDAAGAGAVFPHCVKIEDAAYAKAAFAMAAPDANAKARAALEADEAELLAASDAAADAESEADAAIAAAADAAAAEAAEDVAAAAHAADARDVDNSSLDNSRYRLQSEPSKTGTLRTRRGSCDTYIPENKVLFIRDDGQGLHILFKPEDLKNNLIVLLPVDDPSPQIMRASRLLRGSSTVEGVLLGSILPLFSSVPHDHHELEVFGGARTTRDGNTLDMFMGSKVFTFTACSPLRPKKEFYLAAILRAHKGKLGSKMQYYHCALVYCLEDDAMVQVGLPFVSLSSEAPSGPLTNLALISAAMSKVRLQDFKVVQQASRRADTMGRAHIVAEATEESKKRKLADRAQADEQREAKRVSERRTVPARKRKPKTEVCTIASISFCHCLLVSSHLNPCLQEDEPLSEEDDEEDDYEEIQTKPEEEIKRAPAPDPMMVKLLEEFKFMRDENAALREQLRQRVNAVASPPL